jgi:hypothetical protein
VSLSNDDSVVICAEAVLQRLKQHSPKGEIPHLSQELIVFTGSTYQRQIISRPFSWRLLSGDDLEALEQNEALLQSLKKLWDDNRIALPTMTDPMGNLIRDFNAQNVKRNLIHFSLMQQVCVFVDSKGTLEFDIRELVDFLDEDFKQSVAASVSRVANVPLLNFTLASETMNLAEGLTIEAFPPEEKTDLWGRDHVADGYIGLQQLAAVSHKLCYRYEQPHLAPVNMRGSGYRLLSHAMSALRLLQRGQIFGHVLTDTLRSTSPFSLVGWSGNVLPDFRPPVEILGGTTYYLDGNQETSLRVIFDNLLQLDKTNRLQKLATSLRRFNQYYSRDLDEDKVIDLTVALEASLLFGTEDELRYKVALRGAALLRQINDPRMTFSTLRGLYDVRSKIVHEGATLGNLTEAKRFKTLFSVTTPGDFISGAEEIVRSVLREYVQLISTGKTVEQINSDLEAIVLQALSLPNL